MKYCAIIILIDRNFSLKSAVLQAKLTIYSQFKKNGKQMFENNNEQRGQYKVVVSNFIIKIVSHKKIKFTEITRYY